jgi:hypothetical protein
MNEDEILKLAQQGKLPYEIAEELHISEYHVYRWTPSSWYADPKADEQALKGKPLCLEVSYYTQQQRDSELNGHYDEEQRLRRRLKKCWLKSFEKYHGAKMDIF